MWVFAKNGFVSIVADTTEPRNLMVRARVAGHIEAFFGPSLIDLNRIEVSVTVDADYLYRTSVPRPVVLSALAQEVSALDYPNFKNAAQGDDYHDALSDIWSIMFRLQARLMPKKLHQKAARLFAKRRAARQKRINDAYPFDYQSDGPGPVIGRIADKDVPPRPGE